MSNRFLDDVVRSTRARIPSLPRGLPQARGPAAAERFPGALRGRSRLGVIAEVKRRSPSVGVLDAAADPVARARAYEAAGASAVSVLTEPEHFGGSLDDLQAVAAAVRVPVLMKDFVLSPEQVRVAALYGASAFLVVLRIVDDVLLAELLAAGTELGVAPLLEVHDEAELDRALAVPGGAAAVLGVNNRDLDRLVVDRRTVPRLAPRVPANRVLVAESGYGSAEDLAAVRGAVDAVLVGSALMSAADPAALLRELVG